MYVRLSITLKSHDVLSINRTPTIELLVTGSMANYKPLTAVIETVQQNQAETNGKEVH